jgi:cytochrome c biogenesis protein CcmG/thiol:disulfide interchange protein DsbE
MSVQISTGYITVLQAFSQMVGELCDEMQQQFIKGKLILKQCLKLLISVALLLATTSGFAAVNKAPALRLPAVEGEVDLSILEGKVIYLDFWASWCEPCRESFPWMAAMKEKYGSQGFEVVAINLDKERKLADQFLQAMDVNFIVAFDAAGESASKYELRGMPGSYLIDRDGNIHASHLGFRDKDKAKLEMAIQKLLQQGRGGER